MFATFLFMNALIFTSCIIAQITDDENCETLQSEVHITKGTNSVLYVISLYTKKQIENKVFHLFQTNTMK